MNELNEWVFHHLHSKPNAQWHKMHAYVYNANTWPNSHTVVIESFKAF